MPHRRSWHSSPPLLSPPLIIILFPIVILTILFLALPPLLSAATRLIRPASVKTSWDSLNILIVVFAILCGVFARRNDDEQTPRNNHHDAVPDRNAAFRRVPSEGQSQWPGFTGERKEYINDTPLNRFQSPATGDTPLRMRRNSSSYPDLRQWETGDERYKFRFSDDFEIDKQFRTPARDHFPAFDHRKRLPESPPSLSPQPQPQHQHQHHQQQDDEEKEIPVDTFETRPSSPPVKSITPTPPPPPPPPPQPESARRNARRSHRKTERLSEITVELDEREFTTIRSPSPSPPTPPPPSAKVRSERKSERKKSNVKREIAMVWASVLSNQRKKKKKQRAKNNHDQHYEDNVDELANSTTVPPPTPPPPPPPPPPTSMFHSLFRKGLGKSKKIHSVSPPPPPPPPPPSKRWSKRKSHNPPPSPPSPASPASPPRRRNTGRPPLPSRSVNFHDEIHESANIGNQSPLIPVPPPPPPFKMKAMKFVVRGDFVRIRSNQSSRCSSPEREEIIINVSESTVSESVTDGNGVFCPSPDVNIKAESFIAKRRGEWKLEKLNSLKEKSNVSLPRRL